MTEIIVQGRHLDEAALLEIQAVVDGNPSWSRRRIADELTQRWDWRNAAGRLKDMSCRLMLARLEEKGVVRLPIRRMVPSRRQSRVIPLMLGVDVSVIEGPLSRLQPVSIEMVGYKSDSIHLFDSLLTQHHYLGYAYPIGANVRYLIRGNDGRPLACAVWSSAALKVASRDLWLGWSSDQRMSGLCHLANNTRFLVLPWVRVPHLASHLLGLMVQRLVHDWKATTGHDLVLLETFVEESRFRGICYRAANWLDIGRTTGRTRDDRYNSIKTPIKRVMLLPLRPLNRLQKMLAS